VLRFVFVYFVLLENFFLVEFGSGWKEFSQQWPIICTVGY